MSSKKLEKFEQAYSDEYLWEYRDESQHQKAEFVLVSHTLERKIVVDKQDNEVKLYDTSHPTGVGELDWWGTEPERSAYNWIKSKINYRLPENN